MRVVSVVGYKGVGKTTLIEALVPALAEHGRVATVKSIHHDVTIDGDGTDTHRHREAGAETVVGVAPTMTFEVHSQGKQGDMTVEQVLRGFARDGYEYVIVEGFKDRELPSIVVGEVSEAELSGSIVSRVEERSEVDVPSLVDSIQRLPSWPAEEKTDG